MSAMLGSKPLGGTSPRFTRLPGDKTKNNPLVGQNLPAITSVAQGQPLSSRKTSQGPRVVGIGQKVPQTSGPGEPPEGFVTGTTSKSEWYFAWALMKLLGPMGEQWVFQKAVNGGNNQLGGAVIDFVIYQPGVRIGIRIVSHRFHLNAGPKQKLHDYEQYIAYSDHDFIIIDVFEQDYINDESGQAAIRIALEAINRKERPHPLASGFVIGSA